MGLHDCVARWLIGIGLILLAALVLVLLVAWYDGGRVEQRLIEEPVGVPALVERA